MFTEDFTEVPKEVSLLAKGHCVRVGPIARLDTPRVIISHVLDALKDFKSCVDVRIRDSLELKGSNIGQILLLVGPIALTVVAYSHLAYLDQIFSN